MRNAEPTAWSVTSDDASGLIVGREDTLHLQSPEAVCVESVVVKNESGKSIGADWKAAKPDTLQVKLALQDAKPGPLTLQVKKYGSAQPDQVAVQSYAESAHLDSFTIHAGDSHRHAARTRLDEVAALAINGVAFAPEDLSRSNQQDELKMAAGSANEAAN